MAPKGRIRKPAPKVASADSSLSKSLPPGKNISPIALA
jgi:hypothetical protein